MESVLVSASFLFILTFFTKPKVNISHKEFLVMQLTLAIDTITTFIKEYVAESGADGIVVGVSGGVDSAVTAVLCRKALGESRVQCLYFKDSNTPAVDYDDICKLISKFPMRCELIDISEIIKFASFSDDKIVEGNLRSRIRMALLYQCANIHNYLVCGTSNKTELFLGYFTKYGDGGVDIEPLGDVYKSDVKKIAERIGIIDEILKKSPSAGFFIGQTDESELGAEYTLIDKAIKNPSASLKLSESLNLLMKKNEHKRRLPPIPSIKNL
jgi:NAD+ synthase